MGYPIEYQILSLIIWILLLVFIQISVLPFLEWLEKPFRIPVSFALSLLCFALISWYFVLAGLPVQIALIPFILLFIMGIFSRKLSLSYLIAEKRWYLYFFVFLISFLIIKVLNNSYIDVSFEKFTDQMYLASIMLNPHVPPIDSWFVGGNLTWYYYLSQWPYACLGFILGIPSFVVYNLVIPTVFAIVSLIILSISTLFLQRFRYLPLATLFISFPSFYLVLVPLMMRNHIPYTPIIKLTTRIMPDAITESPLTALFIGSPRAYALGMINQVLMLFLICYFFTRFREMGRKELYGYFPICILCLGSMIPMHSWDYLIYLPLFLVSCLIFFYSQLREEGFFTLFRGINIIRQNLSYRLVLSIWLFILVPVGSLLLYLPFIAMMDRAGIGGVAWNPSPSNPENFLLSFGFFIFCFSLYVISTYRKNPSILIIGIIPALLGFISVSLILIPLLGIIKKGLNSPMSIFASAGLSLLFFCEFFSFVDAAGVDRMNTTYKLYFIAWILLSISLWIHVGLALEQNLQNIKPEVFSQAIPIYIVFFLVITPVFLISFSHPGLYTPTLDGSSGIESKRMPAELHAIQFLRTLPPGEVIVEGVSTMAGDNDDLNKYFSRISTFTGIPTILGSYSREILYRNQSELDIRVSDVSTLYSNPQQTDRIMKKYGATLLFTGFLEYTAYNITDPWVFKKAGFTPVWMEGSYGIWRPPYTRA